MTIGARFLALALLGGCAGIDNPFADPDAPDPFGGVQLAFLVPCDLPARLGGGQSVWGVIESTVASCDGAETVVGDPEGVVCADWIAAVEGLGECPGGVSDIRSDILSFRFDHVEDLGDLEGARAHWLTLSPCHGGRDPQGIEDEIVEGRVDVLADHGGSVQLDVDSDLLDGRFRARMCR